MHRDKTPEATPQATPDRHNAMRFPTESPAAEGQPQTAVLASSQPRPRITIIIPTRDNAAFVEQAICSVLDQGYENLQAIVVDGGSNDGTREIIRTYEDELDWWVSRPDAGAADAINQALQHADGQIIGILPSDDRLMPGALDLVAEKMHDGKVAWLVGQVQTVNEDDLAVDAPDTCVPHSLAAYLMHDHGYLPTAASFFDRRLIDRFGRFDATMQTAWDYEYASRLMAFDEQPTMLERPLAMRRVHDGSTTARRAIAYGRELIAVARRYATSLSRSLRMALWANCDRRERIYALAEAEMRADVARRAVWLKVLRKPWWLSDTNLRKVLLRGVDRPQPRRMAA